MKYKLWMFLSPLVIFLFSSILHFGYDLFPNFFTSLFFPVNESIWEHNKIIFGAFFLWMILDTLFYKKKWHITANVISAIFCSFLVMLVFSFTFFIILTKHDNIIVTFIIYFICIAVAQVFNFYLQKKDRIGKYNTIGIILWLITFSLGAYFTYYPLKTGLFYDYKNESYGIFTKK